MFSFKRGFSFVKQKALQVVSFVKSVPTKVKTAFVGGGLTVISGIASADMAADIQSAYQTGQTNLGAAVTGLFSLLALVVAIGLIYKILNK